jgi:hypothetical protein
MGPPALWEGPPIRACRPGAVRAASSRLGLPLGLPRAEPPIVFRPSPAPGGTPSALRIRESGAGRAGHLAASELVGAAALRGFKTKGEIDEWLAGSRRIDWLRSQGYAK